MSQAPATPMPDPPAAPAGRLPLLPHQRRMLWVASAALGAVVCMLLV